MSNIIIPIITGIVCLAVGVIIGFLYRKSVAEKEIGSAETEAVSYTHLLRHGRGQYLPHLVSIVYGVDYQGI